MADEKNIRPRLTYTNDLQNKIDQLLHSQNKLEIALAELRSSMMPRHEISAEIEKRVSVTSYLSDKSGIENRLKHLEDAPQSSWSRASVLISSGMGCLSLMISVFSVVLAFFIATHIIH